MRRKLFIESPKLSPNNPWAPNDSLHPSSRVQLRGNLWVRLATIQKHTHTTRPGHALRVRCSRCPVCEGGPGLVEGQEDGSCGGPSGIGSIGAGTMHMARDSPSFTTTQKKNAWCAGLSHPSWPHKHWLVKRIQKAKAGISNSFGGWTVWRSPLLSPETRSSRQAMACGDNNKIGCFSSP